MIKNVTPLFRKFIVHKINKNIWKIGVNGISQKVSFYIRVNILLCMPICADDVI